MAPRCEVRIPTYKRPELLMRALESLRAQTHRNFHCLVFDDSPEGEGGEVVKKFPDLEIHYHAANKNAGIYKNLELCFQTKPYIEADFCFCLEDDNNVFSSFIEKNIDIINTYNVNIVLRNQFVESIDGEIIHDRTTMPELLKPGIIPSDILLLSIFTGGGLSNGGLFWRATAKSELRIGLDLDDAVLLEYLRPFVICEDVAFAPTPLGTWKDNRQTSFRIRKGRLSRRLDKYARMATVARLRRAAYRILTARISREEMFDHVPNAAKRRLELSLAGVPVMFRPEHVRLGEVAPRWAFGFATAAFGYARIDKRQLRGMIERKTR